MAALVAGSNLAGSADEPAFREHRRERPARRYIRTGSAELRAKDGLFRVDLGCFLLTSPKAFVITRSAVGAGHSAAIVQDAEAFITRYPPSGLARTVPL